MPATTLLCAAAAHPRRRLLSLTLALCAAGLLPGAVIQDTSFGTNGLVTWAAPSQAMGSAVEAVSPQADGTAYALVRAVDGAYLVHLDAAGQPLTTVIPGGRLKISLPPTMIGGNDPFGSRLSVVPVNGAFHVLLVANGSTPIAYRFLASGVLDSAYGMQGQVPLYESTTSGTMQMITPYSPVLQSDGSIFCGILRQSPASRAMKRYTPAGQPDAAYGVNGEQIYTLANEFNLIGYGGWMTVRPRQDGSVFVGMTNDRPHIIRTTGVDEAFRSTMASALQTAGYTQVYASDCSDATGIFLVVLKGTDWVVIRLTDGGAIDTTFPATTVCSVPTLTGQVRLMATGNGVFVAHYTYASATPACSTLWRVLPGGGLDTTYGGAQASRTIALSGAALRPDGRLIETGTQPQPNGSSPAALRQWLPTGALDAGFDGDGIALLAGVGAGNPIEHVLLTRLPSGALLAMANIYNGLQAYSWMPQSAYFRLSASGQPDASFGDSSGVLGSPGQSIMYANSMAMLGQDTGWNGFIRLSTTPPGITVYNVDGKETATIAPPSGVLSLYPQFIPGNQDGRFYLTGFRSGTSVGALMRLTMAGTLDTAFGNAGVLDLPAGENLVGTLADGSLMTVASVTAAGVGATPTVTLRKRTASGALVTGYGANGAVVISAMGTPQFQADGSALLVESTGGTTTIRRLTVTGIVDGAFGVGGEVQLVQPVGPGSGSSFAQSIRAIDGKWLVYMQCLASSGATMAMVQNRVYRLTLSGTIDATFGTNGVLDALPGNALSILADGRLLEAPGSTIYTGLGGTLPTTTTLTLRRFTADGQLDSSFGPVGVQTLTAPAGMTGILTVNAGGGTGDILVTGVNGTPDAVMARFLLDGTPPPPNTQPVISGSPTTALTDGTAYAFTPVASDADGDSLTFAISNKPAWATFSTTTGALTGTPAAGDRGTYANIVISVSDGKGGSASLPAFTISVTRSGNLAPVIGGLQASYTVELGAAFSQAFTVSDPDGDALGTPTLSGAPTWLTVSGTTLTGTASVLGATATIGLSVSDAGGATGSASFAVTVRDTIAPVVTVAHAPANPGSPVTVVLTVADQDQVAQVSWRNQTTSESGSCTRLSGSATSWTADIPLLNGANQVLFTATDPSGNTGTLTSPFTFTPPKTYYVDAALVALDKTFDQHGLTGKLLRWDGAATTFVAVVGSDKPTVGNYLVVVGVDPATLPATTPWAFGTVDADAPAGGQASGLTPVSTGNATEVGWSGSSVQVESGGITKTLAQAQAAGDAEDYAWSYDEATGRWTLVVDPALAARLAARARGIAVASSIARQVSGRPGLFFLIARKAGLRFRFGAAALSATN